MSDDVPRDLEREPTRESTGVALVDEVIASVQALGDRPVDEHVATFERAHEQLRRALDGHHQAPTSDG